MPAFHLPAPRTWSTSLDSLLSSPGREAWCRASSSDRPDRWCTWCSRWCQWFPAPTTVCPGPWCAWCVHCEPFYPKFGAACCLCCTVSRGNRTEKCFWTFFKPLARERARKFGKTLLSTTQSAAGVRAASELFYFSFPFRVYVKFVYDDRGTLAELTAANVLHSGEWKGRDVFIAYAVGDLKIENENARK